MKWVLKSFLMAITRQNRKTTTFSWMEVGHVSGSFILSPRSKKRLFIASGTLSGGGDSSLDGSSSSRRRLHACTTTPCPTVGWPLVTWKGSGAHVPPSSVQAARAPTRSYSPTVLLTRLRA
ncbi:unnamed protein product [Spirodela intermedia]|uniref:Uncharacterized protein n=1 Tax=Spirodela intermedia TaxID=51605 RepID=A0A7I8JST3_SPIIN|nr:unnamed protein product [Spirodela intermedia]CAA6673184.1 unnamed protein product [Spirodela intermedia]